jgi:hypothetical protein
MQETIRVRIIPEPLRLYFDFSRRCSDMIGHFATELLVLFHLPALSPFSPETFFRALAMGLCEHVILTCSHLAHIKCICQAPQSQPNHTLAFQRRQDFGTAPRHCASYSSWSYFSCRRASYPPAPGSLCSLGAPEFARSRPATFPRSVLVNCLVDGVCLTR